MRIALLREAGGLGDVVCTEPVVRALGAAHPGAEIWYACLPEYRELVSRWPRPPDMYVAVGVHERRDRDGAVDPLRRPYLQFAAESDLTVDLFCPAFVYEREKRERTDRSRVKLFCEAAGVAPSCPRVSLTETDRAWADGWLACRGVDPDKPIIGCQPMACGVRRNWPRDRWAELIARLERRGWQVLVFHSFGGPVRDLGGKMATGMGLVSAAALLDRCSLAVTPDSGFLHLAAALGKPSVSLWGSTHPEITCEFYPHVTPLWAKDGPARPSDCRAPCYSFRGPVSAACRTGCLILSGLSVDEVEAAVVERVGNFLAN